MAKIALARQIPPAIVQRQITAAYAAGADINADGVTRHAAQCRNILQFQHTRCQ